MRLLAALVVLIGLALPAAAADEMPAGDARAAALAGDVVVVDIRTPEEWAESGVADVAHTISMHGEQFAVKLKALMDAHPGKPLALICATGRPVDLCCNRAGAARDRGRERPRGHVRFAGRPRLAEARPAGQGARGPRRRLRCGRRGVGGP